VIIAYYDNTEKDVCETHIKSFKSQVIATQEIADQQNIMTLL